ncbi:hypothetical protein WOC36_04290 [Vibrio parahaemolyticus]|uniref:hypothetical protein n=1 Tax=Vibrio parahaemolyticus TaxID=670 RepID=UPI0015DFF25C|nr:hypothetical protein [Vibrio parahaemolyticus]MBA5877809.1 hypothetical protein [Vibrio parahaemolyticus]MBA5882067.1 hypothetical protein [Vibrio parahaemolyticus]MBA5885453.1 hypothetical protein [Vibrio parahaemolyticus]MBA5889987.1 hypothetical protein [Vibrio parahaemolyticus]MBA5895125.1 hypothetical protein [Vibrio parahaemolyticus]
MNNHVVRGAHLRFFCYKFKTKKSIRYDKNYLSIYRALQRLCVNSLAKKTSEKIMGIEFEIRVKNARIYLRKAMHIGVIGTKITAETFFSRYKFYETYTKGGLNQCTPTLHMKDAYFPMMLDNTSFIVV